MNSMKDEYELTDKALLERIKKLFVVNILGLSHLIVRDTNRGLLKLGYALQIEQIRILITLYVLKNPPSQQDIANMLQKNKAGIQRSIQTLQRDGYLRSTTDDQDKRKNVVVLTPAGKLVAEKAIESLEQMNTQIEKHFDEAEIALLLKIRSKIDELAQQNEK
ncbi:MarR family transcriptional regulator [Siphonobacter sp. BAB-5385]|uniref:MarR family transcriptional regulator n=2 Tax=Cytophagaceae TaxID=89373 RepID=A0A2S7IP63_9BACT|nr:MarR family transcriptional regulator [Siphonobacter sp. BAB-5385]PMD97444.1 MarR family transcriptional regulator [Siphonobacter sp. BAB-5405]PQA59408.1 MarR family transcriptional regulator [Siphonobacter curvatus]